VATDQSDGIGSGGPRLPGWRGLLIVWAVVALAVATVILWAEWRQSPLRQVVATATGHHDPVPGDTTPEPAAAADPATEAAAAAGPATEAPTPPEPAAAPGPVTEAPVPPEPAAAPTLMAEAPAEAEPAPPADPPAAPAQHAEASPAPAPPAAQPATDADPVAADNPASGGEPAAEVATTPATPPAIAAAPPAVVEPAAPAAAPLAIGGPVAPAAAPAVATPAAPPAPEVAAAPAPAPAAAAPEPPAVAAPRPVTLGLTLSPPPAAPAQPAAPTPAPDAPPSGAQAATMPPGLQVPAAVAAGRQVPPAPPPAASAIPAPDMALLEASAHGLLPRRGADGRLPWQYYAQPFHRTDNRPRVAIIIADSGMALSVTEDAIRRLPPLIAIAISPYAPQPALIASRARARGMETLIAVPMEPSGYPLNDPGARPLLTMATSAQNAQNLDWALSRFAGYIGAVGALGSMRGERFAVMPDMMRRVHDSLRERGLIYIDPRPGTLTTERVWGRTVDVILDEPPTRVEVERRLADLDVAARLRGSALGYAGTLTPGLIERLLTWSAGLDARGLVLTPVSAILRVRTPLEPAPAAEPASANR